FSVNFDDGFIIWINGKEAIRVNAPDNPAYNSFSIDQHESGTVETYILPARDINLIEGENTIAVQGFNVNNESSDFVFDLQIHAEAHLVPVIDTLKVIFSQASGFYANPFDLQLDVPDPAYAILYTIDGSNPQTSSTAMNGGTSKTITIDPASTAGRAKTPAFLVRASLKKADSEPTFPQTRTYIFLREVTKQTNPGYDWPTGIRVNKQVIDLDMDPDVTNNPLYKSSMLTALTDIPTISVVTDMKNLFDPTTGIYVNAMQHGEDWERMCSVELINPSGATGFNINAGLRIRGGWSRHDEFPKHAFRLFFRQEYGAAKLKFPLFENEGVDEFDKIDLRCEQNYAWSKGDNVSRYTAVREVFSRDTQRDMEQPYTRSRYYHLYLNGMYWGLYQTQERAEARFAESYFGGKDEDYDVVKVNTEGYNVEATDGTIDSWKRLYILCQKGFLSNADYYALEGKDQFGNPKKGGEILLNIDNLIDYMQVIFYTGNYDAPTSTFMNNQGPNNFYAIEKRDDRSTGFIFFTHDSEHSMMIEPENVGTGLYENRVTLPNMWVGSLEKFHPQWLHSKLANNKEYRQRFADRVYKNFFNSGVFTPDASHERFKKRADQIAKAVIGESARWGDFTTWNGLPKTVEDWNKEINDIYTRFFPVRTDIVLNQLKNANLYPKTFPPVFKRDNVQLTEDVYSFSGNYSISVSGSSEIIYYTLDGTDPRMIGGEINSTAKTIGNGGILNLQGTAVIQSRIKNGDEWSALACIKIINPEEDYSHLKVTELHYHPTDSIAGTDTISGKSFEFIELKNTGNQPINLSGLSFTSSIEYQFGTNEILAPKQFYVIASKPKWFYERHFRIPSGNFANNFSNSGEQVTISTSGGNPVIDFLYSDTNSWPVQPDGEGNSLSSLVRNPTGNPNDFSYWTSSTVYDGTPFADDPGIIDSVDDPVLTANSVLVYPNPTKGALYVKIKNQKSDVILEIFTISGTKVYHSMFFENAVIDFGSLNIQPGMYLVRIQDAEIKTVQKIIYQP
ncbi:MAG: CotH kinase family protein, partial [Prolixibacteraceae bacterium]